MRLRDKNEIVFQHEGHEAISISMSSRPGKGSLFGKGIYTIVVKSIASNCKDPSRMTVQVNSGRQLYENLNFFQKMT